MLLKYKNITFLFISIALQPWFLESNTPELKQISRDVSTLVREAQSTQTRLIQLLTEIDPKNIVIDPGIKQSGTIDQLLKTRWNGDASRITDYSRATLGVKTFFDIYGCLKKVKDLHTVEIVFIRDNFLNPYPEKYRDINIVFRDRVNGHLGEIQINTIPILDYKQNGGHKLFDEMRNIKARAILEERSLSADEKQKIAHLITQSSLGYNKAFEASMKIDDKKIRVGVYGILIRENKILMVRTQSGDRLVYNFPGGGIEFHEGLANALIRECEEEIGATITLTEHIYSSRKLYEHKNFPGTCSLNLYYTIECSAPIDLEKQDGAWFDLDHLPIDEMLEPDIEFAEFIRTT